MNWIYNCHAIALSKLGPIAGPLGLRVLASSGGNAHTKDTPRFPVFIGTQADAARALGVEPARVSRHWAKFRAAFMEASPGRYYPGAELGDPWSSGPMTRDGLPRYIQIGPRAVDRLSRLSETVATIRKNAKGPEDWRSRASLRLAGSAFRLALHILPRLRAGAAGGAPWVYLSAAQSSSGAGVSKATIPAAVHVLEVAGLLKIYRGRRWRVCTRSGLLNDTKKGRPVVALSTKPTELSTGGAELNRNSAELNRPINRVYDLDRKPNRGRRGVGCKASPLGRFFLEAKHHDEHEAAGELMLPHLTPEGAEALAAVAKTEEAAAAWLRQEAAALYGSGLHSPARWFCKVAAVGGSAPGKPSSRALTIRSRSSRRAIVNDYTTDNAPASEQSKEDAEKIAADAFVRIVKAGHHAGIIEAAALKSQDPDAMRDAAEAWRFVSIDAEIAATCYDEIKAEGEEARAAADRQRGALIESAEKMERAAAEREAEIREMEKEAERARGKEAAERLAARFGRATKSKGNQ